MADPLYTRDDYRDALLGMLPDGWAWPKDPGSVQFASAAGLAISLERLDARAQQLLIDAFPSTTVELLPEWEASLGLPDPCAGPLATLEQRQNQVVARFADGGGQSAQTFIAFAAQLGFTITVTSFGPARFGVTTFGEPGYGMDWIFAWQVTAPVNTAASSRFGAAAFGDPYTAWGNQVLECELNARKPAHTILIFNYVGNGGGFLFDDPDDSAFLSV